MAKAPRIITLNLGSQTLGLASFAMQPNGGLILLDYQLREILADPANEGTRHYQIAEVLGELMADLRVRDGNVNFAVPGQSVFTRFVKLPLVEEEKIERIVAFEAQQNVPFPIDDVVWDYQLVGAGINEQVQVVIVAIKADILEDINNAVEGTKLQTRVVDIAPMALYNAFRYNYPDLSGSGCSLLADIGARTTNLLFVEPGKVFTRSIPIGGGSITAAIAKEFGEPFPSAEARKKRDGFVSLGGAYAEPSDPDVGRVSKIVRTSMTRLHAELMRSISHYRTQQQGSAPARILLCGGTAGMRYMREFFYEKLQLPIEFFNPLRNVAVAEMPLVNELARSAHFLGELVGLALRSVTTCPMELNLRPYRVVQRHELEKRRPLLVTAAVCLILVLVGWTFYYARATQVARQSAEELQPKIALMRAADKKLETIRKEAAALDKIASPLIAAIKGRGFWVDLLDDLSSRLPADDIWITELVPLSAGKAVDDKNAADAGTLREITPPGSRGRTGERSAVIDGVLVRGLYMYNPKQEQLVVEFFHKLEGSSYFAVNPSEQARVIRSTIPNNTEWAFPYELHLDLRKPFSIP